MDAIAAPFEILASPLTLWLSPVGTAFPKIDALEGTFDPAWIKVGTSGTGNYTDVGITVTHGQTVVEFTPVGATAPVKAFRTDEKLDLALSLADISPAQYAQALNNAALTTVAATTGVAGEKYFSLKQGIQITTYAMLARGISSVNEVLNAQYQVPTVYQSANPAPVFKKGTPAELALTFTTLQPPGVGGFGELHIQTAAHL